MFWKLCLQITSLHGIPQGVSDIEEQEYVNNIISVLGEVKYLWDS